MVLGEVAGLKNGELVMADVVLGDCRDKIADRLPKSYRLCVAIFTCIWWWTGSQ